MHPKMYILRREALMIGQRLGQYFINNYTNGNIGTDTAENLFYEKDDNRSESIIEKWLNDHHYHTELPTKMT